MIYYAFNDNKPLPNATDKYRVIHYCSNCNTVTCGEWMRKGYIVNGEYKTFRNLREIIEHFARLKKCPVCGNSFGGNIKHHLACGSLWGTYDKLYNIEHGRRTVKCEDLSNESDLQCDEIKTLQEGEKISTEFGPATVVSKCDVDSWIDISYDYYDDTAESVVSMLDYYHSKEYNQIAKKKITSFIDNCVSDSENTITAPIGTNNNFKLKEYLEQLVLIEKNIFSLSKRLENLYLLNCTAEKDAQTSEKIMVLSNVNLVKDALNVYETLKRKNVENEIKITDFPIKYPKEPKKPKKPEEPALAQPGFFNKKRVLAENAVLTEKYEKELETYNLAFEKYESDLKKYNETKSLLEKQRDESYKSAVKNAKSNLEKEIVKAQAKYDELLSKQQEAENNASDIPTPEKAQYQFLKDEIEIAEELLKNFYKARNEMYSYGVIFEKYRDFVAVSSFYEYISSGRCETLEGPNGAYNLYENEIRMNTVIEKLNNVIESLEEIKQNQFMIYSAIQESNNHLKTLNSTTTQMLGALGELNEKAATMESYMSKIAYNTKVAAYNTEKTAFYAKKNAELTNALGFMVALK